MLLHSPPSISPDSRRRIEELIRAQGGGANEEWVADILENALLLLGPQFQRGDVRIIQTAVRELRYAFQLFAPYRDQRKVTVFGSARLKSTDVEYQQAVEFGRKVAEAGFMVITGAGPGIMQAGHEGAGAEHSFGANIRLPWEQVANPVIAEDRKLITFRYFFTRKLTFVRHSDAIVLFPGGFGTMDEGFEALTLMQTGKSRPMPLVLIDRPGGTFWKTWDRHLRDHLLRNGLISEEDVHLYQITDDPDEAVRWIRRFYRNFHSVRFVRELLVMRLQHTPSPAAVEALNEDFADILSGAPFAVYPPTVEERPKPEHQGLARLGFGFNRRSYGRLRQLIDVLNAM
jgi:uncharacterized protein (TIGR00730 family)